MTSESREQFAVLVVAQLNGLWDQPCCAECCAPCSVVQELLTAGTLDEVISWAPDHLKHPWLDGGGVDEAWLRSRWDCQARPRCDDGDGTPVRVAGARWKGGTL